MSIVLSFKDIMKAVGLCMFENIGLRMILAFTRLTAFVGYRSRKSEWGAIKRSEMKKR